MLWVNQTIKIKRAAKQEKKINFKHFLCLSKRKSHCTHHTCGKLLAHTLLFNPKIPLGRLIRLLFVLLVHRLAKVEELAARYLDAARAQQPEGPYRVLGYSYGALLAIEIAHQLVAAGEEVELLVLIDPPPPTPEGEKRYLLNRAVNRVRASESRLGQLRNALAAMIRLIWRRISKLGIRIMGLFQRLFRQQTSSETSKLASQAWEHRARRAYTHRPYSGNTLLLLMGREQVETDDQQLARWDEILQGETTVQFVRGPSVHTGLMEPPWIDQVGVAINSALQASRRDETADQT